MINQAYWTEQHRLNALHATYPMSGDYWEEHFCVYFIVMEPVRGGAIVCDKKIQHKDGWEPDLQKCRFMSEEEMLRQVRYTHRDGWVADVHVARLGAVVAEWRALGCPEVQS